MAYKVTTGPTTEVLTLPEVKNWLKIHADVSDDDSLITGLIATARKWAEHGTGRALLTQTIQEVWDHWPRCFDLSLGPLITAEDNDGPVISFEYRNDAGTYTTWASTNYTVDDASEPGRVVVNPGVSIPLTTTAAQYPNLIRITYTAGSATALAVHDNIKTAMLLQIALMYENREDMPLSKSAGPTARSAWNLLSMSRLGLI